MGYERLLLHYCANSESTHTNTSVKHKAIVQHDYPSLSMCTHGPHYITAHGTVVSAVNHWTGTHHRSALASVSRL